MIVQDLTHLQIDEFLARASYGRIACESEGQPYIACVSLCAESCFLYGFSLSGQKIRLMRANPRVCVEFDETKSARSHPIDAWRRSRLGHRGFRFLRARSRHDRDASPRRHRRAPQQASCRHLRRGARQLSRRCTQVGEWGIDSISVIPSSLIKTFRIAAEAERLARRENIRELA